MKPTVSVTSAEPTAEDADVHHIDQLSERERTCLMRLSQSDSHENVDVRTAVSLSEYDLIKTTEYVRVSCADTDHRSTGVGANT